jgi:hypothetical protein
VESLEALHRRKEEHARIWIFLLTVIAGENERSHEIICAVNNKAFQRSSFEVLMKECLRIVYCQRKCIAPVSNVVLYAIGYKVQHKEGPVFCHDSQPRVNASWSSLHRQMARQAWQRSWRKLRDAVLSAYLLRRSPHYRCITKHGNIILDSKDWKTPNPWLRNATTIVRMTAIDLEGHQVSLQALRNMTVEEMRQSTCSWLYPQPVRQSGQPAQEVKASQGSPREPHSIATSSDNSTPQSCQGQGTLSFLSGATKWWITKETDPFLLQEPTTASPEAVAFGVQHPLKITTRKQRVLDKSNRPGKRVCTICKGDKVGVQWWLYESCKE